MFHNSFFYLENPWVATFVNFQSELVLSRIENFDNYLDESLLHKNEVIKTLYLRPWKTYMMEPFC